MFDKGATYSILTGQRPSFARSAESLDESAETSQGQARELLADLLDWHRREDKPA